MPVALPASPLLPPPRGVRPRLPLSCVIVLLTVSMSPFRL
jgi:hypothetical protein